MPDSRNRRLLSVIAVALWLFGVFPKYLGNGSESEGSECGDRSVHFKLLPTSVRPRRRYFKAKGSGATYCGLKQGLYTFQTFILYKKMDPVHALVGRSRQQDDPFVMAYSIGDRIDKAAPHHESIGALWETKWKKPVSRRNPCESAAGDGDAECGCAELHSARLESIHSSTASWKISSPSLAN